ncbi:GNAT family N-acetyltransferase [Streptomyces sp. NBC_01238]|uniref:GNAT family N-acetyltransferase n=1 Tax=Streptomyces sp. NBC_01238 TaxID=2903791 RepID=UPI003870DB51
MRAGAPAGPRDREDTYARHTYGRPADGRRAGRTADRYGGRTARHAALLAEQAAGTCHFHVLVDTDSGSEGEILGRFNLVDVVDGAAELGYRIAEKATGRGLATAAVRRLCAPAAEEYGLTTLRASTTHDTPASQTVLTRTGFVPTGQQLLLGDRPRLGYVRSIVAEG